jgi:hypothetical protein
MTDQIKGLESWCIGCLQKRAPDAVRILCDCLEAGLRKGEVTANDVRDIQFVEPNIIGATFRGKLPGLGFRCDHTRVVKTVSEKKHSRWVPTWVLEERWKAEKALEVLKNAMFRVGGPITPEQMSLQF